MVSTSFQQFHILHLHYGTSRTICWKPWMLSSLYSGHIVDKNIESLELLPSAHLSKLNVPKKTHFYRRDCGGVSGHRVCSAMTCPPFSSELRMSGVFMSHIRIFSFYHQTQVFLLRSICQLKKLTNQCVSQFPGALILSDVMHCFGAKT